MADKAPQAFRTISEVSELLDTPPHVLRFWESKFTQLKPVKRAGGRRYYRPADVALLAGIRRLLHDDGMTIRGVQKLLREQGVRHVSGLAEEMDAAPALEAVASDPSDTVTEAAGDPPPRAASRRTTEGAATLDPAPDHPAAPAKDTQGTTAGMAPPHAMAAPAEAHAALAGPPETTPDAASPDTTPPPASPAPKAPDVPTSPATAAAAEPAPDLFAGLDMADGESLLPEADAAPLPTAESSGQAATETSPEEGWPRAASRLRGLDRLPADSDTEAWEAVAARVAALHARLSAAAGRPPA